MSVTEFSIHEATIHLNREVIMLIEFYVLPQWIFAPESTAPLQRRLKLEATRHRQKRKTRNEPELLLSGKTWCYIPYFVDRCPVLSVYLLKNQSMTQLTSKEMSLCLSHCCQTDFCWYQTCMNKSEQALTICQITCFLSNPTLLIVFLFMWLICVCIWVFFCLFF